MALGTTVRQIPLVAVEPTDAVLGMCGRAVRIYS